MWLWGCNSLSKRIEMKRIDIDELRKIQMNILDELKRICNENGLTYYLGSGSLLGAVRHKGYIPWDDDIDIWMVREDYDKLMNFLKDRDIEKADWFSLLDESTEGYYYPFAKAVDNRTELKMERHTDHHGIWVDIFPIDGLPKSMLMTKFYIVLGSILRIEALAMDANFKNKDIPLFDRFYKSLFYGLATLYGKRRFAKLYNNYCRRYKIDNSENVASLFVSAGFREILNREKLLHAATYRFEDREYTGFKNYDFYLSQMYGDYMTLPPEEKRRTHAFEAWWK